MHLSPGQFYAEVAEAESWISEKRPLLTSPDLGKDEDSVQVTMVTRLLIVQLLWDRF